MPLREFDAIPTGSFCLFTGEACEANYTAYQGHCYVAVIGEGNVYSWEDARLACEQRGAYLVSFSDKPEQQFVKSM